MAPASNLKQPLSAFSTLSIDDPDGNLMIQRDVPQSAPYAITLSITRAATTYTTTIFLGGSETPIPPATTPQTPQVTRALASTSTPTPENAAPSSQTTIIAATVGSICGVILLIGLIYVCYILNGRQSGGYRKSSRSSSGSSGSRSGSRPVRPQRVRVERTERIRVVPPPPPPVTQRGGLFGGGRGRGRGRARLDQSRSQRILWLLEELQLPYELKIFHRDPKTKFAPEELKKIHPLGKSPIISLTPPNAPPETQPVILVESGFIVEYLIDHCGKGLTLAPTRWKASQEGKVAGETEAWIRYKYFLQYAEGSFMPYILSMLIADNIKDSPVPFFIRPITSTISGKLKSLFVDPNLKTHFTFLENQIKSSPDNGKYICGPHLSGADILLSFPLIATKSRIPQFQKSNYPALYEYTERLEQEPGYLKAVEKIIELEGSFSSNF